MVTRVNWTVLRCSTNAATSEGCLRNVVPHFPQGIPLNVPCSAGSVTIGLRAVSRAEQLPSWHVSRPGNNGSVAIAHTLHSRGSPPKVANDKGRYRQHRTQSRVPTLYVSTPRRLRLKFQT